jgi:hypothetical protein
LQPGTQVGGLREILASLLEWQLDLGVMPMAQEEEYSRCLGFVHDRSSQEARSLQRALLK